MTFASTSSASFRVVKETVFGVTPTPTSDNNAYVLPLSGESLDFSVKREAPAVIHADRAALDMISLSASTTGGIDMDMSAQPVVDLLLEGLMQAGWSVAKADSVVAVTAVTAPNSGLQTLTTAARTGSAILAVGQYFLLSDSAAPNRNNRLLRVVSDTGSLITVTAPDTELTAGTALTTCNLSSRRITHGKAVNTYSVGKLNSDISVSEVFTGQGISSADLSVSAASKSTLKFSFVGSDKVDGNSTVPLFAATGDSLQDLTSVGFHSGVSGAVSTVVFDGQTASTTRIKSLSLNINNNLRVQECIFAGLNPAGLGNSDLSVTGSLDVYMENASWFTKYKANSDVELTFTSLDDNNNGYVFTLPRAKLSKVSAPVSGNGQDLMIKVDFTATLDTTKPTGSSLRKALFIDQIGHTA